jgi:competence protein ComEC
MFDGDAEDISENEMLAKGYDISADVLKVGHHGSSSSTTQAFLNMLTLNMLLYQ